MFSRIPTALVILVLFARATRADEKADILAKQRASAEAKWKKMAFEKMPPLVETANFLFCTRLNEAKAKALTTALEKQYPAMLKALKFDAESPPWPGKLAVFIFTDRDEFTEFQRKVEKRSPKEDEAAFFDFKGEESQLVIGVPRGGKSEQPEADARHELAKALLARKMRSGEPPGWIVLGFAEAAAYRAANPKATGRNPAWKVPALPLATLWTEDIPAKSRLTYAAYVIDYLAFGPLAERFPSFVTALRPDENERAPSMDEALKAINLDTPTLELCARNWVKPNAPPATKPKK